MLLPKFKFYFHLSKFSVSGKIIRYVNVMMFRKNCTHVILVIKLFIQIPYYLGPSINVLILFP